MELLVLAVLCSGAVCSLLHIKNFVGPSSFLPLRYSHFCPSFLPFCVACWSTIPSPPLPASILSPRAIWPNVRCCTLGPYSSKGLFPWLSIGRPLIPHSDMDHRSLTIPAGSGDVCGKAEQGTPTLRHQAQKPHSVTFTSFFHPPSPLQTLSK